MAEIEPQTPEAPEPSRPRSSFGRLVLLGVVCAGLVALAGAKVWVGHDLRINGRTVADEPGSTDLGTLPLAGALGLLLLAAWGVVLVTRGRMRRGIGVLTVLVSLGLVACVVAGWLSLPGDVRAGFPAGSRSGYDLTLHRTGWFWVAAVTSVLSCVVTVLSVRDMPRWPEMGRRYDAPAAAQVDAVPAADDPEADNLALWKAIDQGADPTEVSRHDRPDPSGRGRGGAT